MVNHVVCVGYLPFLIANDWEFETASRDFVNVLDPSAMAVDCVGRQSDQLDTTFRELGLEFSEGAEL